MNKNIQNEFKDFLNTESVAPPAAVSQRVLSEVQKEMSFSVVSVIAKLSFFHVLVTGLVLYICPQFGVSWGASSFTLMTYFMKFGHVACAALCGITLVGGTFLLTALMLKPQESFWLKQQMPWVPISLSILTLILLAAMGAQGHHTEFVFWSVFGIVSGWAAFELGRKGRLYGFRLLSRIAV